MLDTVKINHVQHISFTQSRLTDAVSVILRELLSYEHPSIAAGCQTVDKPICVGRRPRRPTHTPSLRKNGRRGVLMVCPS